MAVPKKNPVTNKWDIQIRYKDSFGNSKKLLAEDLIRRKKQSKLF